MTPVCRRLAGVAAACLLPGAASLRSRSPQEASKPPYRQELGNMRDLQYFGDIAVGGQSVTGILDTGSFELVLFNARCTSCGTAARYDPESSRTYAMGTLQQVHAYGSGACRTRDGFDTVTVGSFSAGRQPMWVANTCDMPLLQHAKFNAIVGLGPPGEPVATAKDKLKELTVEAKAYSDSGAQVPRKIRESITACEEEVNLAKSKLSMLENFGVTTFSQCLGQAPGSPGWLIWNDQTRDGHAGVKKIHVAGNITWGVSLTKMQLGAGHHAVSLGCKDGCASLVDTGTSLFAVPSEMYEHIYSAITKVLESFSSKRSHRHSSDCTDLSKYPDLVMTLGDQQLTFPPSAYLGHYVGEMDKKVSQFIRTDRLGNSGCHLLLMDMGPTTMTPLGPMLILGMPFMREYYTTFDLGHGPGTRSIFVSKATDNCNPSSGAISDVAQRSTAYTHIPRQVDVSKLRIPHWAEHLQGRL